ncbi:hypothetical protein AN477_18645 [Alicyclobacillus ferrooxydans]|uniref:Uncharacterized protein n=1 Tax=Alicyclobacillus ferrooxydans TaxID=471514 RepID=A0A0N8PNS2_9BACL|nr:hypothetical protein AN477_18645 [Alicyclobacillus ferrooxydans]
MVDEGLICHSSLWRPLKIGGDFLLSNQLLNNGRCAEVYEWGEDHVLKVFHQEFAADAVFEFQNSQAMKNIHDRHQRQSRF